MHEARTPGQWTSVGSIMRVMKETYTSTGPRTGLCTTTRLIAEISRIPAGGNHLQFRDGIRKTRRLPSTSKTTVSKIRRSKIIYARPQI
jgi:hypothetical protein